MISGIPRLCASELRILMLMCLWCHSSLSVDFGTLPFQGKRPEVDVDHMAAGQEHQVAVVAILHLPGRSRTLGSVGARYMRREEPATKRSWPEGYPERPTWLN